MFHLESEEEEEAPLKAKPKPKKKKPAPKKPKKPPAAAGPKKQFLFVIFEPAKATGSIISPLSVRSSVRASVTQLISETASRIFSDTWHEVGGQ